MRGWLWSQVIAFQVLWFAAVLGGNQWLVLPLSLIVLHFLFSPTRAADWRVIPVALIGIAADTMMTRLGIFAFDSVPLWLGLLWVGFILTLGHSMAWLRRMPLPLLIPVGALAGTASYLAGWKLQAVELPLGLTVSILVLAILWSVLLPVLVRLDFYIRMQT